MKQKITLSLILILTHFLLLSCKDVYDIQVDLGTVELAADGGTVAFTITTDAAAWNIENPAPEWITLSTTSGNTPKGMVSVIVDSKSLKPRSAVLTIKAENAKDATVTVSQAASELLYELTANVQSIDFKQSGGSNSFAVTSTAPQWTLSSDADWLTFDTKTSTEKITVVTTTSASNTTGNARTATITLQAQHTASLSIAVSQSGALYPSYNLAPIPADMTGMERSATELAKAMTVGWNLGNTLEVPGSETGWGNPKATQRFIDSIYGAGFNAIRLPCAWDSYLENTSTAKIKTSWLNRVKEVVDYCYKNNMYVIINIHWDGGWLENNVTTAKQESVKAKQRAYWEQIATYFRDYDEHLLFAGTNEPNVDNAAQMAVLLSHEQTFIDAVRATGGRNAYRTLIFQGPSTDIEKTNNLMKTLPTDQVQERLMAEVHYYTPWNFCGMEKDESWGKMFYYWGSNNHNASDPTRNASFGEEAAVRSNFNKMKTQFVSKGIPVILGEYGAIRRSNLSGEALEKHLASRAYFLQVVTQESKNYGIVPFYWDNGNTGNNAFGLFYRSSGATFDKQALDAIMKGAGAGVYPF